MPISFIFYGLVGASLTRSNAKRRRILFCTILFLYVGSNDALVNILARAWEHPPVSVKDITQHEVGVLLTGGTVNAQNKHFYYGTSVDRVLQTLVLYRSGKIKKILISGGSGSLSQADTSSENLGIAHLLVLSGVPKEDIWQETASRNTRENALFSAKILQQKGIRSVVIITSAFHVRRADACFEKAGISAIPFPSDFIGSSYRNSWDSLLVPKERAFHALERLVHEMIGYSVYRITGYL